MASSSDETVTVLVPVLSRLMVTPLMASETSLVLRVWTAPPLTVNWESLPAVCVAVSRLVIARKLLVSPAEPKFTVRLPKVFDTMRIVSLEVS